MKTIFVSRHPGAIEWARAAGFPDVKIVQHFYPDRTPMRVIGTLPANLAAAVCDAGGEYWHLSISIPPEWRGRELTAKEMETCGARVERLYVYSQKFFEASIECISEISYRDGYSGRVGFKDCFKRETHLKYLSDQ